MISKNKNAKEKQRETLNNKQKRPLRGKTLFYQKQKKNKKTKGMAEETAPVIGIDDAIAAARAEWKMQFVQLIDF